MLTADLARFSKLIPRGRKNAITGDDLADKYGYNHRLVRKYVAELRKQGEMIINKQDGRGYYKTTSKADMEIQVKLFRHRAMKLLEQCKAIEKVIGDYHETNLFDR